MLSCSTIHKTEAYYKNTTYNQTRNYSHSPSIIFEFQYSTYTNKQLIFYGHGKWKLSDDKKKLILVGVIRMDSEEINDYRPVSYEFEIIKKGKILRDDRFYLQKVEKK